MTFTREMKELHRRRKLAHPLSEEWRRLDHKLLGLYMGQLECPGSAASGTTASSVEG